MGPLEKDLTRAVGGEGGRGGWGGSGAVGSELRSYEFKWDHLRSYEYHLRSYELKWDHLRSYEFKWEAQTEAGRWLAVEGGSCQLFQVGRERWGSLTQKCGDVVIGCVKSGGGQEFPG